MIAGAAQQPYLAPALGSDSQCMSGDVGYRVNWQRTDATVWNGRVIGRWIYGEL
jgi:hypothetical protein